MNKLRATSKTSNDHQDDQAVAPTQEQAPAAPEVPPGSATAKPTGLRSAQANEVDLSLKSSIMAPQTPRVLVPLSITTDLQFVISGEKAPRTIAAARLSLGQAVFVFEDLQSPDKIGKVTLTIPGHEPFHFKRGFTRGGTPIEAVQHAIDFFRNARDKWSLADQDAPEGVQMPPKEFFRDFVKAAQKNATPCDFRDVLLTVTRADEKMSFTFDRSKPGMGHAVRLDGLYCGVVPGAIATLSARPDTGSDKGLVTFNASAYMDGGGISCSGGPSPFVRLEDLVPTDQTAQRTFWRWRDGMSGADRGEYYLLDVPVWSWKGSERSVFEKFDREAFKALISRFQERHPDNRRDIAFLSCKSDGLEEHIYTTGCIHAPFTTGNGERREFFMAQMGVGHSELAAFAAGRTWDECLGNLREDLLRAYDAMKDRPYTDPRRLEHCRVAREVQEYGGQFIDIKPKNVALKVKELVEKMAEQAGEREFLVTTSPKDGEPSSQVVRALTARTALRAAGHQVEDDTFASLADVDASEVQIEGGVVSASAIKPLPRP